MVNVSMNRELQWFEGTQRISREAVVEWQMGNNRGVMLDEDARNMLLLEYRAMNDPGRQFFLSSRIWVKYE